MKYAIVLATVVLSPPAIAQVDASQQSPAGAAQESQPQPDDNHAALAARKRGRLETTIMPSGKRSDCDPSGCTRYEWKTPTTAR